jgi:hypothetical protein
LHIIELLFVLVCARGGLAWQPAKMLICESDLNNS